VFTREDISETYVDPEQMLFELNNAQRKKTHFDNFTFDRHSVVREQARKGSYE
jgi:hypothetical protein